MNTKRARTVTLIVCLLCYSVTPAQGVEDLVKGMARDYLEKKAEEAGLDIGDSAPEQITFQFDTTASEDTFVAVHAGRAASTVASIASNSSGPERTCFDQVQGKIAWDARGVAKRWNDSNVINLCKGTSAPLEPGRCFETFMRDGNAWGRRPNESISWSQASKLCAGTNSANRQIQCLQRQVSAGRSIDTGVTNCTGGTSTETRPIYIPTVVNNSQVTSAAVVSARRRTQGSPNTRTTTTRLNQVEIEQACFDEVQGKIAWDNAGRAKRWSPRNVDRLCRGTRSPKAPGQCFNFMLFRGQDWGRKPDDPMDWTYAIDLCEGTSNANTTTRCFIQAMNRRRDVAAAVASCDR